MLWSQTSHEKAANPNLYRAFDTAVGLENTVLFNGIESVDLQKSINDKNMFLFPSGNFIVGDVFYDGQFFPGVQLKFNVVDDRLLVRIPMDGSYSAFQLITEKIERFSMNGHSFRKIKPTSKEDPYKGFYEELVVGEEAVLLKKHRKTEKKRLDKDFIYFEYNPDDSKYILNLKGDNYPVNSRREIIDVFPELKNEIRVTYRKEKSLRKSDPDAFMKLLFSKIINLQKK